jgi:hypothetical protein
MIGFTWICDESKAKRLLPVRNLSEWLSLSDGMHGDQCQLLYEYYFLGFAVGISKQQVVGV